jgi:hypothetical protein
MLGRPGGTIDDGVIDHCFLDIGDLSLGIFWSLPHWSLVIFTALDLKYWTLDCRIDYTSAPALVP